MSAGTAYTWLIQSCTLDINTRLTTAQTPFIILHNMLKPNVHRHNKASPQANTFHSSNSLCSDHSHLKGFPLPIHGPPLGLVVYLRLYAFFFASLPLREGGEPDMQSVRQPVTQNQRSAERKR